MSSHQDPYHHSDSSPVHYESDSEPFVARPLRSSGQSWSSTGMTSDQSGFAQSHQSLDPVGNLLEVHDAQDMSYSFDPNYSLPSTSSQDPSVRADATFTYENTHCQLFAHLPFSHYPEFDYRHSQNECNYIPYDYPNQSFVHNTHQMSGDFAGSSSVHPAQGTHTYAVSTGTSAPVFPSPSSTQLSSLDCGGPVYRTDAIVARPTLDGVNTARVGLPNADASQYSHRSPVATSSSNQISAAGPSHPPPSSPEKKRLLPLTADEPTVRRVVPRHDRAESVHSASSGSYRRSRSNSDMRRRGPMIPQARYTTSSVSLHNTSRQPPPITFDLENSVEDGIPIIDILNKTESFARIRDPKGAFDHMGKKTFTLRVQWPGYKPWSKTISAMDWTKSRAPITRVKLAETVATAVRDLFEKFRDEPCDPDCAAWNVGPTGIKLDQICLISLHHVSRGSWQPQLCLLESRH